jgi:hypothetical protein
MRILTSLFIAVTLLSFLLMGQVSTVDGQSGIKTPPQATASPDQTEAAFVPDPKRDEYQLIFSKIPEAGRVHRTLGSWERREHHAVSFSDDLTRVGTQGYRLISIAFSPRVAVLRRDDHQYEYAVVQILSRRQAFPNDPKFSLTYEPWARKGFRVADYVVFSDWCENDTWNDGILAPADCTYSSMVVLERRVDAKLPHTYDIVNGPLTFSSKKLEAELLEEIDAGHTNLYPTHLANQVASFAGVTVQRRQPGSC